MIIFIHKWVPLFSYLVTVQMGWRSVQKTRSRNAAFTRQTWNRMIVNFIEKRLRQRHGFPWLASCLCAVDSPHVIPYVDQPEASKKYRMSSVKFCIVKDSRSFARRRSVVGLYAVIQIATQKMSADSRKTIRVTAEQLLPLQHCLHPRRLEVLERQRSAGRSNVDQLRSHTGELHGHGSNTEAQSSPQHGRAGGGPSSASIFVG